jgi:hypothetical protein
LLHSNWTAYSNLGAHGPIFQKLLAGFYVISAVQIQVHWQGKGKGKGKVVPVLN